MEQIRIASPMRFYRAVPDNNNTPRVALTMRDPVDGELLQSAAEKAFRRHPVFRYRVVDDGVRYYFTQNTRKPRVYENDGSRYGLGKYLDDFLLRVSFSGREILLDFFHGISDGIGIFEFLKTLVYYYCTEKYGIAGADLSDISTLDKPLDPEEIRDPFDIKLPEDLTSFGKYKNQGALQIPGKQRAPGSPCRHFRLTLSAAELMRYAREKGTSPAAVFTLLAAKNVAAENPPEEKPIVCAMAMNIRDTLNVRKTTQCCVTTIPVCYHSGFERLSLDNQYTACRGIMDLQMQPENVLLNVAGELAANAKLEERCKTLAEKRAYLSAAASSSDAYTYALSYVGNLSFGKEFDPYIESFQPMLAAGSVPFVMEVLCFRGQFSINYISCLEEDGYAQKYRGMLQREGISCDCRELPDFLECVLEF